jgi:hypothetical protein
MILDPRVTLARVHPAAVAAAAAAAAVLLVAAAAAAVTAAAAVLLVAAAAAAVTAAAHQAAAVAAAAAPPAVAVAAVVIPLVATVHLDLKKDRPKALNDDTSTLIYLVSLSACVCCYLKLSLLTLRPWPGEQLNGNETFVCVVIVTYVEGGL